MSDEKALTNAKTLRSNQTDAEQRLWYHLRAHRFMDLKFKRQKPMGRYIVDFVCMELRLIIEIDGGQHAEQVEYDQRRDAWLRAQGYTVLRFWNNEVMQQLESVLEQIRLTTALSPASGREEQNGGLQDAVGDRGEQSSGLLDAADDREKQGSGLQDV